MLLRCLLAYSLILTPQLRDCSHLLRYSFCQNVQLFVVSSDFLLPVLELFLTTFFSFNSLIDFFSSKSHFYSHNVKFFSKYYYLILEKLHACDWWRAHPTLLCTSCSTLCLSLCSYCSRNITPFYFYRRWVFVFFKCVWHLRLCSLSHSQSYSLCCVSVCECV